MPRPVFADVVMNGGRWRSRRASWGRTSSIVTSEKSHLERTAKVEHCALRAAEEADPAPPLPPARPLRAVLLEPLDDLVEQVAGVLAVHRRQRERIAEPEPVELEGERVATRVVDLVRDEQHGLVRDAQDLG